MDQEWSPRLYGMAGADAILQLRETININGKMLSNHDNSNAPFFL